MKDGETPIRFKEWALRNKDRYINNPIKDFIKDMEYDASFPRSNNKYYISKYLIRCGACSKAMDGFNILFEDFKKLNVENRR